MYAPGKAGEETRDGSEAKSAEVVCAGRGNCPGPRLEEEDRVVLLELVETGGLCLLDEEDEKNDIFGSMTSSCSRPRSDCVQATRTSQACML
jgi:hypothetical protein